MSDTLRSRVVWFRLAGFVVVLVAVTVAAFVVDLPRMAELRALVENFGLLAPVVFVLLYALITLAPLPKNVLSVLAGAVFGFGYGTLLVYLAALLGAACAFGIGRLLGREAVETLTGGRVARVDAALSRQGFLAVIGARLVPVVPFTAINYAAGLTAIRRRDFALGTAIGIIPGTIAYVALGSYAGQPGSWRFELALGAMLLLTFGGLLLVWRRRRSQTQPEKAHPPRDG